MEKQAPTKLRERLIGDLRAFRGIRSAKPAGSWRSWMLGLLTMTAIFAYLVWDKVPVQALARELLGADLRWLLAATVLVVANRFLMSAKWWVILRGEGLRCGLLYVTMITFVGYFVGRAMPGALGMEAVRVWYLARDHGAGTIGLASAIIDRATSFAGLAAVALAAILLFDVPFPGRFVIVAGCVVVLAGFASATLLAARIASWLSAHTPTSVSSLLERAHVRVHAFAIAAAGMQGRRVVVLQSLMLGVAAQIARGLGTALVFASLGYPGAWAIALAVAPIVMFLTMVPLGLSSIAVGAGAMVLLLEPLGVPAEVSLSASLICDALVFVMIPVGAICLAANRSWRKGQPAAAQISQ